jgi:hypothetical protein
MYRLRLLIGLLSVLLFAALQADVKLDTEVTTPTNWSTGYVNAITVTNPSDSTLTSWKVTFNLQPEQTINCFWNGTYTQNGQAISVTNTPENGTILPGKSIVIGYNANNPKMTSSDITGMIATGMTNTPTPSGLALSSTYKVDTVWATAFQTTVTLTNNTNTATSSWTAAFTLPTGYDLSAHLWDGVFTREGQNVTVKNPPGKGAILPGGSATFSMIVMMPASKPAVINNLVAVGNGSPSPIPPPQAPVINPITVAENKSYTVSWSKIENATSYLLQESQNANFTNPQTIFNGSENTFLVSGKTSGTFYYRVQSVVSGVMSAFSAVKSVSLTPPEPPPVIDGLEHSAWYIDWTSWFNGPPFVIPSDNNLLNIFVGELKFDTNGSPTLGGFGNMTLPQMDAFTAFCKAQNPPIAVKVSIGGSGGMYDRCWDRLTSSNVDAFAQGMVDFCHAHGLAGVDFDYEHYTSKEQEALVGNLIKKFKQLDPKLQTSLCSNAGFGPNFPWQAHIKTVLDNAMIASGNCAVDKFYIMSYYDPIQNEQNWINGWASWLKQNYGFTNARVSVGIDDFDANAYDPVEMYNWAVSQGYSTSHWAFDPARPK